MACHWVENTQTGKWEQQCDGAASNVWGWVTTKPSGEHFSGTYDSVYHHTDGSPYQHKAVDIAVNSGTKVLAPHAGKVIYAGWNKQGYGNLVEIAFSGYTILLAHLSQINVALGDIVNVGDVIGLSGSTGNSTGPHIHYEVRQGSGVIDPLQFYGTNINAGIPGRQGNAQPLEVIPVVAGQNGTYQPTTPDNPLAQAGVKQGDGSYNAVDMSKVPQACIDFWKKAHDWENFKNCIEGYWKDKGDQLGEGLSGFMGDCGTDIGCQIVRAIRAAFSIPEDPEQRKAYTARWIVGGVAIILLLMVGYYLISLNQTGKEIVKEYVGLGSVAASPVNTKQLIQKIKEQVQS